MYIVSRASVAVAVLALAASSVSASIISTSGQASLIARPADAQLGSLTDNSTAFAWNEAQGVTIGSAVTIDAFAPGQYTSALSFSVGSIPAGSVLSSHLVHFDTVGGAAHTADGSITLDGIIVGVIAWNRPGAEHLNASDSAFGLGTLFSVGVNRRGVFDVGDGTPGNEDFFSISADRHTLSFHLEVSSPFDQVRVLTMVPAPSAVALLGMVGLVGLRRRVR
ncbi:MAG: hypothetical protein IT432_04900 [Phycisphaerales bacterium]|nr:hypothetical protein [Phycisphaerales bacterium]